MKDHKVDDIYYSEVRAVTIRLKPGEDLKQSVDSFISKNNIAAACLLSCVGSLCEASIRYADQKDVTHLKGKFEIVSLVGILSNSGSHIHISVSDETGKTIGGHLKEGAIIYTTAEIVIAILPDVKYLREIDDTYGYKELRVNNINE
jgi:uncharacterized protein